MTALTRAGYINMHAHSLLLNPLAYYFL